MHIPNAIPTTQAEAAELCRRAKAGDVAARQELVERNYGLAREAARRFDSSNIEEGAQIASIAMLLSPDTYDDSRGAWSTFVFLKMLGYLREDKIDNACLIRVPRGSHDLLMRSLRGRSGKRFIRSKYAQKISREPVPFTRENIETIRLAKIAKRSSKAVGWMDYDDTGVKHEDKFVVKPEPEGYDQEEIGKVYAALRECLSDREVELLVARFGLTGGEKMKLHQISKMMGFTRERARQVIDNALAKVRKHLEKQEREWEFRRATHFRSPNWAGHLNRRGADQNHGAHDAPKSQGQGRAARG